jgi:hypothetical protein
MILGMKPRSCGTTAARHGKKAWKLLAVVMKPIPVD